METAEQAAFGVEKRAHQDVFIVQHANRIVNLNLKPGLILAVFKKHCSSFLDCYSCQAEVVWQQHFLLLFFFASSGVFFGFVVSY